VIKKSISIYTNIPTPYQLDFFDSLSKKSELKIIYYSKAENDRKWKLDSESFNYPVTFLSDSFWVKPFLKKWKDFHFSFEIFKVALKDKSETIIVSGTYNCPNSIIVVFISFLRNKKIAFWGEKIGINNSKLINFIRFFVLIPYKYCCNYFLCIGQAAKNSFQKYGLNQSKFNLPYNINKDLFNKFYLDQDKLNNLRLKLNIGKELVILSSGALIKRKGFDILIKAFKKLETDFPIRLIIIGEGSERDNLKKIIENDKRIMLPGFFEKELIPYLFELSDVFAFPSHYDGWGLVINEAIAAGLPIISTYQCTAANELIINGKNGYLYDSKSVEDLTLILSDLLSSKEKRDEMSRFNEQLSSEIDSEYYSSKLIDYINSIEK